MIKTSLQYVEAVTLWIVFRVPFKQNSVRSPADVADVPVRSLRKPGGPCFWCNVIWRWCILKQFLCVFLAMHKFLSWDCEWQLIHHDHSPCCRRFKAAQKIQAPVTQGWCMNSKGVQENYILLGHFFWRPVSSDSIPRFVCVTRDGTSETYLAQYTWYDDLKFFQINQTMTLFSSYETVILCVHFFGDLRDFFSFRVTLINILRHPWGLYVEYYAGRGPGPQRGNRGIWSRLGHPEVLRFWQHKVEAKASALHTFRWMGCRRKSRPFLHVSFTDHFLLDEIVALQLHQLNCTRIFDTCSHLFVH